MFRSIVEAIGDAVLIFDADGAVRLSNRAADRMFANRPIRDLAGLLRQLGQGGDNQSGTSSPSGTPVEARVAGSMPARWVEMRTYPIDPDGPTGEALLDRIVVLRDITDQRQRRAQREAFLGILSHELRTPVTTIYAGGIVLLRTATDETTRALAGDIAAEADRLYRLVEDLLVMARHERGLLDIAREPVLLQRVVPAAVRSEAANWPASTITVSTPAGLPSVAGDRGYVEQVVRNLLSNAIKYGPPGGEIAITVETEADDVVVRVLDRGVGIDVADEVDLFELFVRSPATAAQAAGAGIGLAVCDRLIGAMGGRIWARRRSGGGSEFGFSLKRFDEESEPDA